MHYLDCVDLKTGEFIYEVNTGADQVNTGGLGVSTTANMFSFGYYYSHDDPNEHGIAKPRMVIHAATTQSVTNQNVDSHGSTLLVFQRL